MFLQPDRQATLNISGMPITLGTKLSHSANQPETLASRMHQAVLAGEHHVSMSSAVVVMACFGSAGLTQTAGINGFDLRAFSTQPLLCQLGRHSAWMSSQPGRLETSNITGLV